MCPCSLPGHIMEIAGMHSFDHLNKVDMQFPYISEWKLHTQACEIVAGTKRELCKKFQVYICKTKKDRSPLVQLHSL